VLPTPIGTMQGSYQITAEDGTQFEAPIPAFTLCVPRVLH
jgi:ApaG protein